MIEEVLENDVFKFSARLDVDYINETYKINLPESENYETLGGLIVNFTEQIPEKNEVVTMGTFQFIVLEVSNTKIDLVELKLLKED
jgi:CBS domain containing-hemolysin-like protein